MTIVATVLAFTMCGCSLIAASGPPKPTVDLDPPRCSDNYAYPIFDGAVVAATIAGLVRSNHNSGGDRAFADVSGLLVIPLLAFGASAVHGMSKASTCGEAKAAFAELRRAHLANTARDEEAVRAEQAAMDASRRPTTTPPDAGIDAGADAAVTPTAAP